MSDPVEGRPSCSQSRYYAFCHMCPLPHAMNANHSCEKILQRPNFSQLCELGIYCVRRVMSQLLVEMDGLNPRIGVTVIAATNRPDKIDAALLRPGRFDRLVYVGPPNQAERKEIFDIHTRKMPCGSDLTTLELASVTDGYTGADISSVCREAAMAALEENIDIQEVSMRHFKFALDRVQPSDLSAYENLSAKFQRLTSSGVGDGTIT